MSAVFVVAGAGLVLSSPAPGRPVQDVLRGCGSAVGEAGDQPLYLEVVPYGGMSYPVRARLWSRAMPSITW